MVYLTLGDEIAASAAEVAEILRTNDIYVGVVAEKRFRLVTHRWIDDQAIQDVIQAFSAVIKSL
jgi:threonine aldolase